MLSELDLITTTLYPPLPSMCCICNFSADGKRKFLDFQKSLDVYGAVCICEACMWPVAQILNLVPREELETVENRANEVTDILAVVRIEKRELQVQYERLQAAVDTIISVRPDLDSGNSGNDDLASSDSNESDEPAKTGFSGKRDNDSKFVKPATERGSEDVPQSSSLTGHIKL